MKLADVLNALGCLIWAFLVPAFVIAWADVSVSKRSAADGYAVQLVVFIAIGIGLFARALTRV